MVIGLHLRMGASGVDRGLTISLIARLHFEWNDDGQIDYHRVSLGPRSRFVGRWW